VQFKQNDVVLDKLQAAPAKLHSLVKEGSSSVKAIELKKSFQPLLLKRMEM